MNDVLFLTLLYAIRFLPFFILYFKPDILRRIVLDVVDLAIEEIAEQDEEKISISDGIKRLLQGDVAGFIKALGYIRVAPRAFSLINSIDEKTYRRALVKAYKRYRYLHSIPLIIRTLMKTAYGMRRPVSSCR